MWGLVLHRQGLWVLRKIETGQIMDEEMKDILKDITNIFKEITDALKILDARVAVLERINVMTGRQQL